MNLEENMYEINSTRSIKERKEAMKENYNVYRFGNFQFISEVENDVLL